MHIQIINFQLKDLNEEDYAKLCNDLAPSFADIPGLISKVWIANSSTGIFGGVYYWKDKGAMDEFAKTELFQSVATHSNLQNITSTDFAVMEEPTGITRGFPVSK